jgi:crotonobetainyl-CoA:carnitine CoA-transferase CaiB-like acyl-CoA transferase
LPAPTLGEHTDAVLAELGYDENKIAELRAASVI